MSMQHRRLPIHRVSACPTGLAPASQAQSKAGGELVLAMHVTSAAPLLDPTDAPAYLSPFGIYYALHDAVVRPLPGERMGNALAESWSESPDGLSYEFKLRPGLKFHNGGPCTAEDVQFSFMRYKGTGGKEFKSKVKGVEVV